MKLFFIASIDDYGENLDLMVRAKNIEDAVRFWETHHSDILDEDEVRSVEAVDLTTEDFRVFESHVLARVFDVSHPCLEEIEGAINWSEIPICALVKTR